MNSEKSGRRRQTDVSESFFMTVTLLSNRNGGNVTCKRLKEQPRPASGPVCFELLVKGD